ncbi:MAG: hypothetical protein FH762_09525 [Firmicutes bacterium]|nr:hypothetical protein [Bacillota bacterium]
MYLDVCKRNNDPKLPFWEKLLELFNEAPEEITEFINNYLKPATFPIFKHITASEPFNDKYKLGEKETLRNKVKNVADGGYYYLQVNDDSMKGIGINKDDLLFVKQITDFRPEEKISDDQNKINSGDVAVVLVRGHEEAIIRTLYKIKTKDNILKYRLQPQNHNYEVLELEAKDVQLFGKCIEGSYGIIIIYHQCLGGLPINTKSLILLTIISPIKNYYLYKIKNLARFLQPGIYINKQLISIAY